MSGQTLGQVAREAFGELGADWYPGTPWEGLHEDLRAQWEAAASAVASHLAEQFEAARRGERAVTAAGLPGVLVIARAALHDIALGTAGDPSVAADEALTRMREAAAAGTSPDVRPHPTLPRWVDVTCGACGKESSTNCGIDDIQCTECDARRCPHCGGWFGGER